MEIQHQRFGAYEARLKCNEKSFYHLLTNFYGFSQETISEASLVHYLLFSNFGGLKETDAKLENFTI